MLTFVVAWLNLNSHTQQDGDKRLWREGAKREPGAARDGGGHITAPTDSRPPQWALTNGQDGDFVLRVCIHTYICYLKENHSSTDSLPNAQGHQGRARTHNSIRVSLNECQGPSHCSRRLLPPRVSMLRKLSVDRKPVSQTSCQMPPPSPSLFHHHY